MHGTTSMPDKAQATREARLRRAAQRQGLRLKKSRRRDPRASDYHTWWVFRGDVAILGGRWGTSLEDVEAYLTGDAKWRPV